MISIAGLDKALVLKALYDNAQPLGMGGLHFRPGSMSEDEANRIVASSEGRLYFDYVGGRPLKVDLAGDQFDPRLYDRDQGDGAAARAIAALRLERA
jgi:hypothetical protein